MNFLKRMRLLFISIVLPAVLWQCAGTGKTTPPRLSSQIPSNNIRIDSTLVNDGAMEAAIYPYRTQLNKTMGEVVGHASMDLKRGKPEARLNNFVADLMLKRANKEYSAPVDAAITNVGGLRVNISKGPVTLGKIYEVMPFENELVVLEMTGSQLLTLGKQIGEVEGECIAGMKLEFRDKRLMNMTVQGEKVEAKKLYYIVTTDYLSAPGHKKLSILGTVSRKFLGIRLRDAILGEVKELEAAGKPVQAQKDGRIVFK